MNAAAYLLAAARHFVAPATAPALPPLNPDEAPALLRLAAAHGVLAPLSRSLPPDALPPEPNLQLRAAAVRQARRALAQTAELARIAACLDAAALPFLALKGPLLSRQLHADVARRASGDLDILVRRPDALPAIAALRSLDYALAAPPGWRAVAACRAARDAEVSLLAGEDALDLHWRALPPYFVNPLGKRDEFGWRGCAPQAVAGRAIACLEGDALLLFLCAHAAKHCFERLGWVWDIAACLAARPGHDWAPALAQARATRTLRMVHVGVRLAQALFGVEAPPLPEDPAAYALLGRVLTRYCAGRHGHVPAADEIRLVGPMLERPMQRVRYLAGQLKPSAAEYRAWRLPSTLRALYYPYRFARLSSRLARLTAPTPPSDEDEP